MSGSRLERLSCLCRQLKGRDQKGGGGRSRQASEPVWQEGRSHWLDEVGVGIAGEAGEAGGSQIVALVRLEWTFTLKGGS